MVRRKKIIVRSVDIRVNFVMEEEHSFDVVYGDNLWSFELHSDALQKVKELSYLTNDEGNMKVYDETYDADYLMKDGEILGDIRWKSYMELYRERYMLTFKGLYKESLINWIEEELIENVKEFEGMF